MNEIILSLQNNLENVRTGISLLESSMAQVEKDALALFKKNALMQYDETLVKEFLKKPYILRHVRQHIHELWIPRFIQFSAGWPVRTEGEYNVFQVSRFIDLFKPLPDWLREELNYTPADFKAHIEGDWLIVDQGDPANVFIKHGAKKMFSLRRGNKLKIIQGKQFDVMRNLIRSGVLPYVPKEIKKSLTRKPTGKIKLRPQQMRDFNLFLKNGNVSVIAKGGAGKSYFGMYACESITGPKLILAPRKSILQQWKARIEHYLPAEYAKEVQYKTYQSLARGKMGKEKFSLIIFDEIQHLPSDMGMRASQIPCEAKIGLTATPWREDGHEDLIPALCGLPVGMDWPTNDSAKAFVWIVNDVVEQMKLLEKLAKKPTKGKTMIFVYRLDVGKRISNWLGIPFIHGGTRKQYQAIQEADTFVISKIGDAGVSVNATRVIEVDFLGGRVEAGQRASRTGHAVDDSEFHMITTKADYKKFNYRLAALTALDFELKVYGG